MYIDPNMLVEAFRGSANRFPTPSCSHYDPSRGPNELKEQVESMKSYAENLYKKYEKYVGDMDNNWTKRTTVVCMENWSRATKYLEATVSTSIANFNKFAFPLIRAILPATATEKAFTVQPMLGPTSQIFSLQATYGTTTGKVTAGQPLWGETVDAQYGDSVIQDESIGVGTGAIANYAANLDYAPIVPGTITITDGTQTLTDDGANVFVGDGTGTINYTTGAYNITFTAVVASGEIIEASYNVDNEVDAGAIPEIDLTLTASPVTAHRKAIRFRYSLIAAYALRDQYGVEGEGELVKATAAEIAFGIDITNFKAVTRVALDVRNTAEYQYDRTVPTGGHAMDWRNFFIETLIKGSSYILKKSGRVVGNGLIGDEIVTNMLEGIGLPRFVPTPQVATRGIQEVGVLDGRWTILRTVNPEFIGLGVGEFMMYAKMPEFLYAGYVWAPWIAAFETPTTILDDFQGRKGMASLSGHKIINANYYLKMKTIKS